jgi:hypothetical protein
MAKVTLMDGIQSISGRLGDVCYRTQKNGTVVVSMLPRKQRTRVSEKQEAHREWFGNTNKKVAAILKDPKQRAIYEQWWRQDGKKRETLRHFIFKKVSATVACRSADEEK